MRFKPTGINVSNFGTGIVLSIGIPSIYGKDVDRLVGGFRANTEYELKPYKAKRSLSANAYCWALLDKLAEKLKNTPEEIYKIAISHVGVFEELEFASKEAMERFKRIWRTNGTGWLTKTIGEKTVLAYYGSSTYDTQQMARLIDYIQDECKEQGIEVRPQWEVDAMLTELDKRG